MSHQLQSLSPDPILTTTDQQLSDTWTLVLSAMGITHQVVRRDDCYQLFVEKGMETRSQSELDTYFRENESWPHRSPEPGEFAPFFYPPSLLLMGLMSLFYSVTGPWKGGSDWFSNGAGNTTAILNNFEWWRLLTALTLHADVVHLTGNCLLGGILIHFLCKTTGNGLGLFSLLTSSFIGNLVNTLIKGPGYSFIGFSTTVFTAIGMLAMLNHLEKKSFDRSHFLMPVMAGAALLAMLGSSGERTDLGAHLFGLISGLLTGWLLHLKPLWQMRRSPVFQLLLFFLFLAVIAICWYLALANNH